MSKIDLEFVELHAPLFLNGKNLGQKLDHKKHPSIRMAWDNEEKMLYVSYAHLGGHPKVGVIPASSVHCMVAADTSKKEEAKPAPGPTGPAQVSTPQSHVHAGEGKGKTGKVVL